ncbi:TonB-dependent receptor domain-containing protein [Epibacterium sp. Ofav1-8]|uniref:TonB-dependent receptor domain-containing protein n=1 Tax=Epibacterium sp. Ofav1-8 TaxID=2917735 RepID=UPI001EF6F545|nr:TonB-dependent receptor [Epibacterium sp. Ofav1-8]MCG7621861.1 TonB-dependent receptor [Epibacterium sp. Ofav1-8]
MPLSQGKTIASVWLLLTGAGLPTAALTQDAAPDDFGAAIELEEITVSRPAAGEEIAQETIRAAQPTSLNELFADTDDVTVSGGNRTSAQKVYIRGIEDVRATVTIDGALTSGTLFPHNGNSGIDPFLLKSVAIDAGTGTALSGPSALAGEVRFETLDPEDFLLPGQRQGAMLRLSGQTNGDRLSLGTAIYGQPTDRFGYALYGATSFADTYTGGDGQRVPYTDSEPDTLFAKLKLRPADGHTLEFSAIRRSDDGLRSAQVNFGVDPAHPRSTPEQQALSQDTYSLSYRIAPAGSPALDLEARLFQNETELHRHIDPTQRAAWRTRGFAVQNASALGALDLTYGLDFTEARSSGQDGAAAEVSETARTWGAFVQAEMQLSERLRATGGLRYDHSTLTDLAGNRHAGHRVNPNLGVEFQATPALSLFASWAQAFRGVQPAPGLNLTAGVDAALTDPSLDGETAETIEAGFAFVRNGWNLGATYFQTEIEDVILYGGRRGLPYARRNAGTAETEGYTLSAGYAWADWSVQASFHHSDTTIGGRYVSPSDWYDGFAPQGDTLSLRVVRELAGRNMQISWTSQFVMAEDKLPDSFTAAAELAGYDVHDLSLVWRPRDTQEYSLALTNIFDEAYIAHGTAYSVPGGTTNLLEQGRSLRVTAQIKF